MCWWSSQPIYPPAILLMKHFCAVYGIKLRLAIRITKNTEKFFDVQLNPKVSNTMSKAWRICCKNGM